jgi:hypothetical protein
MQIYFRRKQDYLLLCHLRLVGKAFGQNAQHVRRDVVFRVSAGKLADEPDNRGAGFGASGQIKILGEPDDCPSVRGGVLLDQVADDGQRFGDDGVFGAGDLVEEDFEGAGEVSSVGLCAAADSLYACADEGEGGVVGEVFELAQDDAFQVEAAVREDEGEDLDFQSPDMLWVG